MRIIPQISAIILASLLLSSCGKYNCGGVDSIQYAYGMDLRNNADSTGVVKATNGVYFDELYLQPLIRSEKGDRNCRNKDYVTKFGESIDTSTINVYCNRELMTQNIRIAAGTNLRKTKLYDGRRIELELDALTVINEPYTYYVKGTTDKGNNFIDSITVHYQP